MNHEAVAEEWAEAYIKGSIVERWRIAEACEENGTLAALVMARLMMEELCGALFNELTSDRPLSVYSSAFVADLKGIAAGDDPPTSPACPEAMR